ncbi:hypothetical protein TFLX_02290 [Thermoflexales bacterium]|jgi:hypothetical protein|nr:hypothetical protein TFLX_02290 [Thermoflexales bacterium]
MPQVRHQFFVWGAKDSAMAQQIGDSAREVFIVRLWRETQDGATWQGQVQHVRTGTTVRVRNTRELLDYLADQFKETDAPPAREKGLR